MLERLKEARSHLFEHGYCVIADVLSTERTQQLREALDQISELERRQKTCWFSHGNQRIFMLLNKHDIFLELIDDELALGLVETLLEKHFLLSSITANITCPANHLQQLHVDQGYVPPPWPRCEAVNVAWVIDEFTKQNGATRLVPGSHRNHKTPPENECISISAPEGAVICLDGRVWHGTGQNQTTTTKRRGIFSYYCRPYFRQQENFSRSLSPRLLPKLNNSQRTLLGFDIWEGLGAVNGLPTDWMDGRDRIGPTNSDGIFDVDKKAVST